MIAALCLCAIVSSTAGVIVGYFIGICRGPLGISAGERNVSE